MLNKNKIIDPNFTDVINIFNQNKIKYWLCHGTLLGIMRDSSLIEWDHDIDLALWDSLNEKNKIIELMLNNGFALRKGFGIENDVISFSRNGGRIVDINFYLRKKLKNSHEKVAYIKWFVPKNIFCKIIDALSKSRKYNGKFKIIIRLFFLFEGFFNYLKLILIKFNFFYKEIGYSEPEYLLKNIKKIELDNLSLNIPNEYEKYLEYLYGKNWKTPNRNYIWYKDSTALTSPKDLD